MFLVTQGGSLSSTVISLFGTKFVNILVKVSLNSLTWVCTLIFEKAFSQWKLAVALFMASWLALP